MFAVPQIEDVLAAAQRLGISMGHDEAAIYQRSLTDQLSVLDAFVQSRDVEEAVPPLRQQTRDRGRRPSAKEDPLNAWLWRCHIRAREDGLLAGKTVSFKDTIPVAGLPLTFGSFAMESFTADFDATVVARVLDAGGTIIGKNSCSGFVGGYGNGGRIGDYDPPINPHDRGRVPGGSSSGSAVAVASGEVDIAIGGDQGGSIRMPAAYSGTLGLKPTFGLVSNFGVGVGFDPSLDSVGPMARTAEDAALALEAVAGFDGLDPRQGRDVPEHLDVRAELEDGVAGVRLGILEQGFDNVDADVIVAVEEAIDVLAAAGMTVSKVSLPAHARVGHAYAALAAEGALGIFRTGLLGMFAKTYYPPSLIETVNRMWEMHASLLSPRVKSQLLLGEFSRMHYHGRVYAKAQNVRSGFVEAYDRALGDVDVLVMPTVPAVAPEIAQEADRLALIERAMTTVGPPRIANTAPFNYTGHPALAVPCGKSAGLPVSMQLVGRFFDDPLLLRVAHAYQHAVDWAAIIGVGDQPAHSTTAGMPFD